MVRVNGSRAVLMTILKAGAASTLDVIDGVKSLLTRVKESLPVEPQSRCRRRSIGVRQGRGVRRHSRGRARRGPRRRDDPACFSAAGVRPSSSSPKFRSPSCSRSRAVAARRDHQRHDARRPGARRRHPGRRRHRDHREHQLSPRAGQGDRARDHGRRAADRDPGFRHPALPVHRVRADVPAWRRRRLSVPAAGGSGGVRADRLVHPVAYARADDGELPDEQPSSHRSRPTSATTRLPIRSRNPLLRFQQGFEQHFERFRGRYRALLVRALESAEDFHCGFLACVVRLVRRWCRSWARTSFLPSIPARS